MNAIALHARASTDFDKKLAATQNLLRETGELYQPLTQASSLGVEDMVITHLLHALGVKSEVFVLQTGKLHAQTLDLLSTVKKQFSGQRTIRIYEPDAQAAEAFEAANGKDAMYKSIALRKQCCDIRKMKPLAIALDGKRAWITGLRKEQSDARAAVHAIDESGEKIKVNPLHDWTLGDVWHYVKTHNVPYNALHDQFYPSIGCEPCTRAVTLGEDFRSGRWWWENEAAKECGLHVAAEAKSFAT
ncbi:phosphoadenylyl-sulfate reductase [Variovorax sp. PCZ-1]|uniref:phosphoadenylyl-sulfate reductase n=1 Tax=Variovorax sp. PCZ-1 TaxID=2835533 RepID=UPI001BCC72CD|nr:phosphoadenylyl-sulfate reductase [Variovorax sp. PCZ-1]MBS7806840.1 phosphoadenylyl-sulfate reductase [Variovorax sp. PCZ-1]